jgi:hypothetical protein
MDGLDEPQARKFSAENPVSAGQGGFQLKTSSVSSGFQSKPGYSNLPLPVVLCTHDGTQRI